MSRAAFGLELAAFGLELAVFGFELGALGLDVDLGAVFPEQLADGVGAATQNANRDASETASEARSVRWRRRSSTRWRAPSARSLRIDALCGWEGAGPAAACASALAPW